MHQAQDKIDFDPPPGCPPYSVGVCRCKVVNLALREKVERASRAIVLTAKEEEARIGGLVPDAWFRERLSSPDGPIMILHRHYAGMGGRPMMGKGVGGFALGAACPSGGLAAVTTCTYDFQWFALLINRNLSAVMEAPEHGGAMETFDSKVPDRFTCWQLNFGKNESPEMSKMCFYNPHVDKNNAKVSSMGTSYGDYEGGGVWIAHPDGKTLVEFDTDTSGVHPGLVPGHVLHQKVKWLTFWAATKVHAIPPFRKNRVGLVAFSSQTALRVTPEERKFLDALEFKMPATGDVRFLPACPYLVRLKEDEVNNLSPEDLEKREGQQAEYETDLREHQRECDKMAFELAAETMLINKKRIICTVTREPDGRTAIVTTRTTAFTERAIEEQSAAEFNALETEAGVISELIDVLEKMSKEKKDNGVEEKRIDAMWRSLHKDFKRELVDYPIFDEESDDELSDVAESGGSDAKAPNNGCRGANPSTCAERQTAPHQSCEPKMADAAAPASDAQSSAAEAPDADVKSSDVDLETSEKDETGDAGSSPVTLTVERVTEQRQKSSDTKNDAVTKGEAPHPPVCTDNSVSAEAPGEDQTPDGSSGICDTTNTGTVVKEDTATISKECAVEGTPAAPGSVTPTAKEEHSNAWWTKGGDLLVEVRVVLEDSRGCVVQNAAGEPVFFDELKDVHLFARSDAAMLSRTQRKNYEGRRWTQKLRHNVDPSKFDADHFNAVARKVAGEASARTNTSACSQLNNPHSKSATPRHPSPPLQAPPKTTTASSTSAALAVAARATAGRSTSSSSAPPGSTAAALAQAALRARASHQAHIAQQQRQRQLHEQQQRQGPVLVEIDDDEEDDLEIVKSTRSLVASSPSGPAPLVVGLPREKRALAPSASGTSSAPSMFSALRPFSALPSPFRPPSQAPWNLISPVAPSLKRQAPPGDASKDSSSSVAKKSCFGPSAVHGYHQQITGGALLRFGHPFTRPFLPGEVVCLEERNESASGAGAVVVD
eukprot:GEMP01011062.1.p1 GENE.GEMP01011062.1~~GEMP01011062.1.p1  ORF type:complete len:1001 (+),score=310.76 GEMP01011062.1:105-3107(+)